MCYGEVILPRYKIHNNNQYRGADVKCSLVYGYRQRGCNLLACNTHTIPHFPRNIAMTAFYNNVAVICKGFPHVGNSVKRYLQCTTPVAILFSTLSFTQRCYNMLHYSYEPSIHIIVHSPSHVIKLTSITASVGTFYLESNITSFCVKQNNKRISNIFQTTSRYSKIIFKCSKILFCSHILFKNIEDILQWSRATLI